MKVLTQKKLSKELKILKLKKSFKNGRRSWSEDNPNVMNLFSKRKNLINRMPDSRLY
jgi:hypothetical protein